MPSPRLLVVLAHPDDEVLALGARLERLAASRVLTITDGAPANGDDARHHGFASLEEYRSARHHELKEALTHAGLPDGIAPRFPAAVPDQSVGLHLTKLARVVAEEIARFEPEAILTHPYEGGHPDHDACAFVVHAAVRLVAQAQGTGEQIAVLEAPFYHAGQNGRMQTGEFFPGPQTDAGLVYELNPEERANKAARLACFRSQAETLAQFGVERESYRFAPRYDFTVRPHAGQLFYEQFPWGMTGERLCELAAEALEDLFGPEQREMVGQPLRPGLATR